MKDRENLGPLRIFVRYIFLFAFISAAVSASAQLSCSYAFYQDKDTGCFPYPILATAAENSASPIAERKWYLTTCAGAPVYTTPTGINSTFSYTPPAAGCYNLRLWTRNTNGDTCSYLRRNIVESDIPNISATISTAEICLDGSTTLNMNNKASCGTITNTTILWGCGPTTDFTNDPASVSHTYSSANCAATCYDVTVVAKNSCGCFASKTYPGMVCLVNAPRANFTADVRDIQCAASLTSHLTADDAGSNMIYTWYINGAPVTNNNSRFLTYTFTSTPTCYDIKLVVKHPSGCIDSMVKEKYICASATPNLNYTQDLSNPCIAPNASRQQCLHGGNGAIWTVTGPAGFAPISNQQINDLCFPVSIAGDYNVTISISNGPGCSGTKTVPASFTVRTAPVPCFTISDSFSCQPNLCVNFTNCTTPLAGKSYGWTFGTPGASIPSSVLATPPQVCYTGYGRRTVTLEVVDINGCSVSLQKDIIIDSVKALFVIEHPQGCAPLTTTIRATPAVPPGDLITNYKWTSIPPFLNQTGPALSTINQTFPTVGCYKIKLEVTTQQGCTFSYLGDSVCVGQKPVCTMTATPTTKCYDTVPVKFFFSCDTLNLVIVNFGEGNPEAFHNLKSKDTIRHVYQDFGDFDVWAVVAMDSCFSDTLRTHITIHPSRADFKDSVSCKNDSLILLNTTKRATRYHWDFSCSFDTSNQKNVSVLLPPCTNCMATLTVYNDSFGCVDHKRLPVSTPCNTFPTIQSDSFFCVGSRPKFVNSTPRADAGITTWWLNTKGGPVIPCPAGDCFTATGTTLNLGQFARGIYHLAMIYQAPGGCVDTVYQDFRMCGIAPGFTPDAICLPDKVNFAATGPDSLCTNYTSWKWTFTGGTPATSTLPNPVVAYATAGVYAVNLIVSNGTGCTGSVQKNISIGSRVDTDWSRDSMVCPGQPVCITNNTTAPTPLTEYWSFPGGVPDTFFGHNPPCVVYNTEGEYAMTYHVISGTCDKTEVQMVSIHTPVLRGSVSDRHLLCPSKSKVIDATDNSLHVNYATDEVAWYFYDTVRRITKPVLFGQTVPQILDQAGAYVVTLCITTNNGCKVCKVIDTITVEGPIGFVTPSHTTSCACLDSIDFTIATAAATNIQFLMGCSQGFFTDSSLVPGTLQNLNVIHYRSAYCVTDTCSPSLYMLDSLGCSIPLILPPIYIDSPAVNFTYNNLHLCDSGTVMFYDSTFYHLPADTSRTVSWAWDFGDPGSTGNTSDSARPSHFYSKPGSYTVKLLVQSNYGCIDSITKTVIVYPRPSAAFGLADYVICSNEPVCILDSTTSANPIISQVWSYGDGFTSASPAPCHLYSAPFQNTYTIKNVVLDANQCIDRASAVVKVNRVPVADFAWMRVCETDTTPFHSTSQAGSGALDSCAYTFWLGAAAPLVDNNCDTKYKFAPGRYPVQLTVADVNGCVSTKIDTVIVDSLTSLAINPGDTTICVGNSVNYFLQGQYSTLKWVPAIWVSDLQAPNVTITPLGDVKYTVTAQSGVCPPVTQSFAITVIPSLPLSATAVPDRIVKGLISHLSADSLPRNGNVVQIDSIIWSPDSTLSCNNCPNPDAAPGETTTYMVTVYYSENGYTCSIADFVTVRVLNSCDSGLIFVPNTFTPNGDDINDVFMIRGLGATHINYFRIFDRWGGLVFETTNGIPNETKWGWDGTDRYGKKLNGGVYVYMYEIVCLDRETITGKGNVTLVK